MSRSVCPTCQAEFENDLLEGQGGVGSPMPRCPFCGAGLSVTQDDAGKTTTEDDVAPIAAQGDVPAWWTPVPPRSSIQVADCSDERLLLILPGGKNAGGFGCFALMWNGFMALFTGIVLMASFQQGGPKDSGLLFMLMIVGVFWAIGCGLTFIWLKLRFERTLVLLEPRRMAIQKVLLGRRRLVETELSAGQKAELAEAYRQNNVPVYHIKVQGSSSKLTFGTSLTNDEKDWLVDSINRFLGVEPPEPLPAWGSTPVAVIAVAPLSTSALPPESPIVVEVSDRDHLTLHYPIIPYAKVRFVLGFILLAFSGIWFAGISTTLFKARDAAAFLFMIPFALGGLVPMVMAMFALFGRTRVDLTADTLSCRWGLGPFNRTWSLPTSSLDLIAPTQIAATSQGRGPRNAATVAYYCAARGQGKTIMLTLPEKSVSRDGIPGLSAQVAGLLHDKLTEMGITLPEQTEHPRRN